MLLLICTCGANRPPEGGIREEEEAALSSSERTCSQARVRSPKKGSSPSTHSSLVPNPVLGLTGVHHTMGQDVTLFLSSVKQIPPLDELGPRTDRAERLFGSRSAMTSEDLQPVSLSNYFP